MAISTEELRARQQAEQGGNTKIAQAIQEVSERAQILVREEIELAKTELTQKMTTLAKGAVVGIVAGVFAMIGLLFVLHGLAWMIWYLIFPSGTYFWGFYVVAGILFILGALAGFLASRAFKKGTPPMPAMAIDEAKRIRETVRSEHPETTV